MILFCVLVDRDGKMSDVFQSTAVDIYEKKEKWELIRHKKLKGIFPQTTAEVRNFSEYLVKDLKEMNCNILIGTSITGVPYYILDKNEIILCEAQENNEIVLNAIYEDFCVQKEKVILKESTKSELYAIEEEGTYYFDFLQIFQNNPELTTKKVLLPFFEKTIFHTLILKTSHMIPWLTEYANKKRLTVQMSNKENVCVLKIEHEICDDAKEAVRCKV